MATLAGNTIASTYPLLLKIDSSGIDGTLRAVEDGDGTDSALSIATDSVLVKGDGIKLYFYYMPINKYINQLPKERQWCIKKLISVIRKNLPQEFNEQMNYGMPSWVVPQSNFVKYI